MLAHVIAILGLAYFAWDVRRTVIRLRSVRGPSLVSAPGAHVCMAVVLAIVFLMLYPVSSVPVYVTPIGVALSAIYFIEARKVARARQKKPIVPVRNRS